LNNLKCDILVSKVWVFKWVNLYRYMEETSSGRLHMEFEFFNVSDNGERVQSVVGLLYTLNAAAP
jgi:hypothetical protein